MMLHSASPSAAVISVGADNPYGHPAAALLDRLEDTGAHIYRTDRHGAITVKFHTDGTVSVRTYLTQEDNP